MALSFNQSYKNSDSTSDLNLRLKDVCSKGFLTGGAVTPATGLSVTVSPFVAVNFDGAVVRSTATETLSGFVSGTKSYVVLRAKYNAFLSPTLSLQVLSAAAYAGDPDINWLHVLATVDLTSGGPYVSIPAANVSYVERHAVDPMGRTPYRPHVATAASLATAPYLPPLADNRLGDIVYAMDTGSFYDWNGSAWVIADDGAITHRDNEHSNGIVADSAANTLDASAAGTDVSITTVAAGSGYTVNGRFLTSVSPLTIAASTAGATRGLLQLSVADTGTASLSYRVSLLGGLTIAQARIVDISDDHPTGNFVLQTTATTAVWDGGPPVTFTVGARTRLYSADQLSWVDIIFTGTPAATTDSYTVSSVAQSENAFLLAYFFWDGSTTLVLGTDKARFGTIATAQLSDEFKDNTLYPLFDDLREDGVASGGIVTGLAGPAARVTGPLVVYLGGRRFVPRITFGGDKGYTGLALPSSGTRFLYVDSSGVFQVASSLPTSGRYATVATVVTSGGSVTSVTDTRYSSLNISDEARFVRDGATDRIVVVDSAGAAKDFRSRTLESSTGFVSSAYSSSALAFEDSLTAITGTVTVTNGSATVTGSGTAFRTQCPPGTWLRFGTASGRDSVAFRVLSVASNTSMTLSATYTGTSGSKSAAVVTFVHAATDNNLLLAQPLSTSSSLVSAIRDSQRAQQYGLGCIGINACPITFTGTSVTIGAGEFYDFQGRRVVVPSPVVIDTSSLANGSYDIYWDGELNGNTGGFDVGGVLLGSTFNHGALTWRRSLAFGIVRKAAGSNVEVSQCQLYATGSSCQEEFSIGADAGVVSLFGRAGNFPTIRKAFVFRSCYGGVGSDVGTAPRRFAVYDQIDEGEDNIDFADFEFSTTAADHLDGFHVYGSSVTSTTVNRGIIRWGIDGSAKDQPLFDLGNLVNSIKFTDLRFEHKGNTGTVNDNCWAKNPGQNMTVDNCSFSPDANSPFGQPLQCLVSYTTTSSLGGNAYSVLTPGTTFTNCTFRNICDGTEMFNLETASMSGSLTFTDCHFGNASIDGITATTARIVNVVSASSSVNITFRGGTIGTFNSTIVESTSSDGRYRVFGATIQPEAGAYLGPNTGIMEMDGCHITASVSAFGVRSMRNCTTGTGAVITGDAATTLDNCEVSFTGDFRALARCRLDLGTSGIITSASAQDVSITDTRIVKSNGNAQACTVISISNATSAIIDGVRISFTGSSTDLTATVIASAVVAFAMSNVTTTLSGTRRAPFYSITNCTTATVDNCTFTKTDALDGKLFLGVASGGNLVTVTNNKFQLTGTTSDPQIVAEFTNVQQPEFSNNKIYWGAINGTSTSTVSIEMAQDAAITSSMSVTGNNILLTATSGTGDGVINVLMSKTAGTIQSAVVDRNTMIVRKTAASNSSSISISDAFIATARSNVLNTGSAINTDTIAVASSCTHGIVSQNVAKVNTNSATNNDLTVIAIADFNYNLDL